MTATLTDEREPNGIHAVDLPSTIPYQNIDTADLQTQAAAHLLPYAGPWHPTLITHASGTTLTTSTGHRILDWTSGQMSTLIGHGHPEIVTTVATHAQHLDHLFSGMLSPPVISLARELTSLLPPPLSKAMFLSTGGESNEVALKLAKHYTGGFEVVALAESWHGMTAAAQGAQYKAGRRGAGPLVPGNLVLPAPNAYRSVFRAADGGYDWRAELEFGWSMVDKASCGALAAVILEPILSSGGMLTLPEGYLRAMKEHCERRGMLLVVDEAQTALGRAGDTFAFQHEGVVPDILTMSKTLGNGLPLSAVVTSDAITTGARDRGFMFYTTHVNDPLPAAVGLKVLEVVQRDGLAERAKKAGERLHSGLRRLEKRYGCIGDVRGRGLMAGLEIVKDRQTKEADMQLSEELATKMLELGLNANLSNMSYFAGVFRIAPPMTTTDEELDRGLAILEEAFRVAEGTQPLHP